LKPKGVQMAAILSSSPVIAIREQLERMSHPGFDADLVSRLTDR